MPRKKKEDEVAAKSTNNMIMVFDKEYDEEHVYKYWQAYEHFKLKNEMLSVIKHPDEISSNEMSDETKDWMQKNEDKILVRLPEFVTVWGDTQNDVLVNNNADNKSLIIKTIKDIYEKEVGNTSNEEKKTE